MDSVLCGSNISSTDEQQLVSKWVFLGPISKEYPKSQTGNELFEGAAAAANRFIAYWNLVPIPEIHKVKIKKWFPFGFQQLYIYQKGLQNP